MKRSIWVLVLTISSLYSTCAHALYEKDGLLCHTTGGRYNKREVCEAPRDPSLLNRVRDEGAYFKRLDHCKFSSFKTWDGEIKRLINKRSGALATIKMGREEMYWSSQDVKKQAFLPSEQVRNAYANIELWNPIVTEAERDVHGYNWCIACANARKNGAPDCKGI